MLHHISFNARDPEGVAHALAEMLDATCVRAPAPPFPEAAWFVCFGDANGSLIEVMPWGETRDASTPRGVGYDAEMRPSSGAHVLASTALKADELFALADREGWRAEQADAGLFKFIKVWVENAFLVEFLTPELRAAYVEAFNATGVASVDAKLRELETAIRAKLG
ncbi:hypothetical protein [Terricaulis sp.]|uniref:hypothetical protein n=1 Tax=Terricaulis sp. TaxID=2768686 RepID=UPI003784FC7F